MRVRLLSLGVLLLLALGVVALGGPDETPTKMELVADGPVAPSPSPAPALEVTRPAPAQPAPAADGEEGIEEELQRVAEKDLPPDPPATGDCTLTVLMTRDVDDEPFATPVGLWRIDEPGNEHWSHGDRKQPAPAEIVAGRATWHDLAPGRYRIHASKQPKGSADPEPFEVAGEQTTVSLALPAPKSVEVRVLLFDETGSVLRRGFKRSRGASSSSHGPARPKWVKRRHPKHGFIGSGGGGWFGTGCGCGGSKSVPVEGDERGFLLGRFREPTRYENRSSSWELGASRRSTASVHVKLEDGRPMRYVAASMSLASIQARVLLPDGTPAVDAGAKIRASAKAMAVPEGKEAPRWDALTVSVHVTLEGYAPLDAVLTFGDSSSLYYLQPTGE